MKKIFFIGAIVLSVGFSAFYAMMVTAPEEISLVQGHKAHQALSSIFEVTQVHEKIENYKKLQNNTLNESVIKVTQQEWLRKPGTERSEMAGLHEDKAEALIPYFITLGMCTEIYPQKEKYTYGVVLGALAPTVAKRLKFLDSLCAKGIALDQLVLLTGERALTADEKTYLAQHFGLSKDLSSETEMMAFLFGQHDLTTHLKELPLHIVDTPAPPKATRPTTNDTIEHWIKTGNPKPGSCLVISSNPFIPYQNAVVKALLPSSFTIETVGPIDSRLEGSPTKVALLLDSLARWLYQENERQKKL
jgi:hypothetical protein